MILLLHAVRGHVRTNLGSVQDRRQVQPLPLPVVDRLLRPELVGAADHLLELPEPELRHQLADLFGHEKEVVHDMFRLAGELRPERRIVGGDADRTGVQVALAHHDAALDDEGSGREAELLGAQQRGDHDITAGLHLSVGFHPDASAQVVQDEGLLRLGQAELPRNAAILNGGKRRGPGPSAVSADQDLIGFGL